MSRCSQSRDGRLCPQRSDGIAKADPFNPGDSLEAPPGAGQSPVPMKPSDLCTLARAHTQSAIDVLADIMNNPESPHGARLAAAQALIERGWGKSNATGGDAEQGGPGRRTIIRRFIVKPGHQDG
jgi:hypothetical protein